MVLNCRRQTNVDFDSAVFRAAVMRSSSNDRLGSDWGRVGRRRMTGPRRAPDGREGCVDAQILRRTPCHGIVVQMRAELNHNKN